MKKILKKKSDPSWLKLNKMEDMNENMALDRVEWWNRIHVLVRLCWAELIIDPFFNATQFWKTWKILSNNRYTLCTTCQKLSSSRWCDKRNSFFLWKFSRYKRKLKFPHIQSKRGSRCVKCLVFIIDSLNVEDMSLNKLLIIDLIFILQSFAIGLMSQPLWLQCGILFPSLYGTIYAVDVCSTHTLSLSDYQFNKKSM